MLKIKDINNPTDNEIKELVDSFDEEQCCKYCKYNSDCVYGVRCYGDSPVFPPCADSSYLEMFDYDVYANELEQAELVEKVED
jgi:hypothetical protein